MSLYRVARRTLILLPEIEVRQHAKMKIMLHANSFRFR